MALFFDARWFDAKLAAAGLSKPDLALAMGLSDDQLAELWKDQRELKPGDIRTLALMLNVTEAEVAHRAGVQGTPRPPVPAPSDVPTDPAAAGLDAEADPIQALERRLTRMEADLAEVKRLLTLLLERR